MIVRRARTDEIAWANERYAEIDFVPSSADARQWVAEVEGQRVGLGRLVPVGSGDEELGGIYVLPAWRGRGIAEAVVGELVRCRAGGRLFCLPFERLAGFYGRFGFRPVTTEPVPRPIAAKHAWCAATYPDPTVLLILTD